MTGKANRHRTPKKETRGGAPTGGMKGKQAAQGNPSGREVEAIGAAGDLEPRAGGTLGECEVGAEGDLVGGLEEGEGEAAGEVAADNGIATAG